MRKQIAIAYPISEKTQKPTKRGAVHIYIDTNKKAYTSGRGDVIAYFDDFYIGESPRSKLCLNDSDSIYTDIGSIYAYDGICDYMIEFFNVPEWGLYFNNKILI